MLVLASNSPRRQQILRDAGIAFVVRAPNIHEERHPDELPGDYVRRLAEDKAFAVPRSDDEIVLAADTSGRRRRRGARKATRRRRCAAHAALAVRPRTRSDHRDLLALLDRNKIVDAATTRVRFVPLTEPELEAYASSGEPMDKAGGYAIQGLASKFIDRVEGCYFNVVGLPMALVYSHLKALRRW